jgi:hypothetical protein
MNEKVTSEDLKILEELRRSTKSAFEHTKILALISVGSGKPIEITSEILKLHPKTIKRYVQEWCKKKRSGMSEADQNQNLINNRP